MKRNKVRQTKLVVSLCYQCNSLNCETEEGCQRWLVRVPSTTFVDHHRFYQ